jgi:hypothetical protein
MYEGEKQGAMRYWGTGMSSLTSSKVVLLRRIIVDGDILGEELMRLRKFEGKPNVFTLSVC